MPDTPDEPRIDYGDSFDIPWGNVGDPRWPEQIEVRLMRRDEDGQRLIVERRTYREEPHDA